MASTVDLYAFMQFTAISPPCSSVPVSIIKHVKVCPAVLLEQVCHVVAIDYRLIWLKCHCSSHSHLTVRGRDGEGEREGK